VIGNPVQFTSNLQSSIPMMEHSGRPPLIYHKTDYVKRQVPVGDHLSAEALIACNNNSDIVNLGTAENHLIEDLILPIFQTRPNQPAESLYYRASQNDLPLRTAFANLLRDHFSIPNAQPSQIIVRPGISFFGDRGSSGILNAEDSFLLPIPYYDPIAHLLGISGAQCVTLDLNDLPSEPPANARLLQLINPGNPIGELVPNIEQLLKWAHQKADLHIICDEIYALSNRSGRAFQSIAAHPAADPQRVHMVYSLAKDWALGGLHVGFFYTQNREIHEMIERVSGPVRVSSDAQWVCLQIFENKVRRDDILKTSIERMKTAEQLVIELLQEAKIRYIEVNYCPYVMIDLSDIAGDDLTQELSVWRELRDKYGVNIMPGEGCFHFKTGWFRLCFCLEAAVLKEGMKRLIHALAEIRRRHQS
jgi:aspartate/methionine/tyrosine aminotransferase